MRARAGFLAVYACARLGPRYARKVAPIIFAACSLTSPDLSPAHGAYELVSVDDAPLPVPIEAGDCPLEIFEGPMGLSPEISGRSPLFTIIVHVRLQCDPSRTLPVEVNPLIRDFGEWTIISGAVQFRSEKGYGAQLVPMEPAEPGILGPRLTLDLDGRRYAFRRTRLYGQTP